ncbi:hypothetical protein LZC95_49585 [Pendulispora brunnea]|uniref:Carboxypeptidase regulatory-like domain-containing protein n=1 Tax=Pendulispora brunnea TaxID=2905690 RepID=A0ABZ2K722_9BACT
MTGRSNRPASGLHCARVMQNPGYAASLVARPTLVTCLLWALAATGCASRTEAAAVAVSSAMSPYDSQRLGASTSQRPGQPAEEEQRRSVARESQTICFRGNVSSTGPFGHPLERVSVRAALEGEANVETSTDVGGEFHLCIKRESQSLGKGILGSRYVDRRVPAHIVFERTGFATRKMDVTLDTADRERKLDVSLESASTAQAP